MGKRRETSTEDDLSLELTDISPSHKKHKKHKHKKHKKSKTHHESDIPSDLNSEAEVQVPLIKDEVVDKLKSNAIKNALDKPGSSTPQQSGTPPKVKKKKRRESATSSEEERWLDAIESGKLEEVDDELKKIKPKDPKLMTARQRAMYDRGGEMIPGGEVLMALPSGYKEKVMTAEAIQKAALKSQKRKQMADEKREKDKKKTMERLLKKQESKTGKLLKGRMFKLQVPFISYRINNNGITLSFPHDMKYPLEKQGEPKEHPQTVKCQVIGCTKPKKYNCNKTNIALCSLECYKRNFENLRKIII